jgi:PPOX class probable F420-dependent enzyme
VELPSDVVDRVIEAWPVARLATVGPDGPHAVPIVFARAGGCLWSPIDGKPKRGGELARVRHLRAEPRATLLIDRWDPDWSRLWWLRIDVTAAVIQPADPVADLRVAGAERALRSKYPQYDALPLLGEPPTLLEFTPRRVRSWCAGPDAAPSV